MEQHIRRLHHERRQYFWHNYLAHSIEGGLYMGGLTFIAADSVMPAMINLLGGSNEMIALMPVMNLLGVAWPVLLVAHRVEQLYWMKPFVLVTGLFQRLIYLAAALALIFLAPTHPTAALLIAVSAPLISGSIGGSNVCAWMELVARVIPPDRLASSWAIRKILTAVIGILAGGIVTTVLQRHSGYEGFGILHLYAFAGLMGSYLFFAMIRETKPLPKRADHPNRSWLENMQSLPRLIRDYPEYRRFLHVKLSTMGIYIPTPFLAIHALESTGREPGFLGELVMAQMAGSIGGNMLAGYLGDRHGGRILLILARLSLIALCLGAVFTQSPTAFLILFFMLGFGLNVNEVGEATVTLEVVPPDRRPTGVALITAVTFPGMLLAAGLSALLRGMTHSMMPSSLIAAVLLVVSLAMTLRITTRARV